MKILTHRDTVGIVACSNGLDESSKLKIGKLEKTLNLLGLKVILSNKLYRENYVFSGSGKERAEVLMNFFYDSNIKAIFDISGGDLANEVLEHLDYEEIKKNPKPFFGYSDLSVIINSIYAKTGVKTYLYQLRNLIGSNSEIQKNEFKDTFLDDGNKLLNFKYEWIQGTIIDGVVIGGNIRCFLKLSGTEYMPNFQNKILFLESLSGGVAKMSTYLTQYKQLGVFNKIKGIILGSFTEMEREEYKPDIVELVKKIVNDNNMPIIKTNQIGHGQDSKCIIIGEKIRLN